MRRPVSKSLHLQGLPYLPTAGRLGDHLKKLKNNACAGNTGHFHIEIDIARSEGVAGLMVDNIKPQGDRFVFSDIHRVIVLASGRLLNWSAPLASFLLVAGAA